MEQKQQTARARNAALRAEVEAWLAASDGPDAGPFVNLRAMGFSSMRDAQAWARANGVACVLLGGKLLARRADLEPHRGSTPDATPEAARADGAGIPVEALADLLFAHAAEVLDAPRSEGT